MSFQNLITYVNINSSTCTYNLPVGTVPLSSVVALITDQLPVTTVKVKLNVVFNVKYGYLYYNYCSMTRHIKVNIPTQCLPHCMVKTIVIGWMQCCTITSFLSLKHN